MDELNRVFGELLKENPELAPLFQSRSTMPRWTYYELGRKRFCYNIQPFGSAESKPYASWIYLTKRTKDGKHLTCIKKVYFARRKIAAKRALQWYQSAKARREKRRLKRQPTCNPWPPFPASDSPNLV